MGILDAIDKFLSTGDPEVREWFLIKSKFLPFFLCGMYLWVVLSIGPSMMKNRKPFRLREIMIVYNGIIAAIYAWGVIQSSYHFYLIGIGSFCKTVDAITPKSLATTMLNCGWIMYVLKYVEFLDTIFFILRKRFDLVTNLHVIHHSILPIFSWIFARTERSVLQGVPIFINSAIHAVMYSYYGLAAIGPSMKKYLWWKKYLTIAQMIQFILIFSLVVVVMPLTGCSTNKTSAVINVTIFLLFFPLFLNFYLHTFNPKKEKEHANGQSHTNGERKIFAKESRIKSR